MSYGRAHITGDEAFRGVIRVKHRSMEEPEIMYRGPYSTKGSARSQAKIEAGRYYDEDWDDATNSYKQTLRKDIESVDYWVEVADVWMKVLTGCLRDT